MGVNRAYVEEIMLKAERAPKLVGQERFSMINVPAAQQLRFAKKAPRQPKVTRLPVPTLLKDHNYRLQQSPWTPSFSAAFRLIILARFFAGMYTILSDCDEGSVPSSLAMIPA